MALRDFYLGHGADCSRVDSDGCGTPASRLPSPSLSHHGRDPRRRSPAHSAGSVRLLRAARVPSRSWFAGAAIYELTDPLGCRAGQNFTVCVYRVGIGIVRFRAVRSRCAHGMRCRLDRTAVGLPVLPASQAAAASHNAANTQEPRMSEGQCTPRYSRVAATATA